MQNLLIAAGAAVLLHFGLATHDTLLAALAGSDLTSRRRASVLGGLRQAAREIGHLPRRHEPAQPWLGGRHGLALEMIGLPYPLAWACVTAALCFIPYAGPAAVTLLLALAGSVAGGGGFGLPAPPLAFLALHAVEASLLGPWLMSSHLPLHTVTVLLSVLVLGWTWGIGGGLLAVPLLIGLRAVCRRHAPLRRYMPLLQPHAPAFWPSRS